MRENYNMHSIEQVIVIDDDYPSLFLCKIILEQKFTNKKIVTYNNPLTAVDYFKSAFTKNPIKTLLLVDINMPEISGWEVLDFIIELDQEIKKLITVIMLSSSIDPKDKQKATDHPSALAYLEKPLNVEELEVVMNIR